MIHVAKTTQERTFPAIAAFRTLPARSWTFAIQMPFTCTWSSSTILSALIAAVKNRPNAGQKSNGWRVSRRLRMRLRPLAGDAWPQTDFVRESHAGEERTDCAGCVVRTCRHGASQDRRCTDQVPVSMPRGHGFTMHQKPVMNPVINAAGAWKIAVSL